MHTLTFRLHQALGDAVALSAVIRDLARQHPQYRVTLDVNWKPVWQNNPHAEIGGGAGRRFELGYTAGVAASRAGRPVHLIRALCEDVYAKAGVRVEPELPHGDLHMTPDELAVSPVSGRYWVVVAGGKLDMTVKHWHAARYQEVVDRLRAYGVQCVQAGAAADNHVHPPLAGCLSAVGRTENVRDLFRLVAHADGVVCGVTGVMHVAAALGRPCVVIAGGREEPTFFGYSNDDLKRTFGPNCRPLAVEHKILHTVGLLHCCGTGGCWRKRTVAIDARDVGRPNRICLEPVRTGDHPVPRCLDLIGVDHVVEAVLAFYADGTLPPLQRGRSCESLHQVRYGTG